MSDIVQELRAIAADAVSSSGKTMDAWDRIRHQVEQHKGSDLPRLNFEGLMEDFAEKLQAAADEIERLRPEGWRPIESAPKDGTRVQLSNGNWVAEGHWHSMGVQDGIERGLWKPSALLAFPINTFKPTHWQPLPPPPLNTEDPK